MTLNLNDALFVLYLGYACVLLYTLFFKRKTQLRSGSNALPKVSILKPVGVGETEALLNFSSFCEQESVEFELILGLQDPDVVLLNTLKTLQLTYPHVSIKWLYCAKSLDGNPKVHTLLQMLSHAQYDWLLFSDSDMRVEKDYLKKILAETSRSSAVVTHLYRSKMVARSGGVGVVEALRSAGECHVGALVAHGLTNTFLGGWGILIHRDALASVGGWDALKLMLGEDFALAKLLKRKGWFIHLAPVVSVNVQNKESFKELWERYIRWNKGILTHEPLGYWALLIQYIPLWMIFAYWMHWISPMLLGEVWLIRCMMALAVGFYYLRDSVVIRYIWMIPVTDGLGLLVWLRSFWGHTCFWRGRKYRVNRYGIMGLCQDE